MRYFITTVTLILIFISKQTAAQTSIETLLGPWNAKLELPTTIIPLELVFEKNDEGKLAGTINTPNSTKIPAGLEEIEFAGGVFSFSITAIQAKYKGKFINNEIIGEWNQSGMTIPVSLKKGYYVDAILTLPDEIRDQLLGQWHGIIKTPVGGTIVAFRFETDKLNRVIGFVDIPERQQLNMLITNAVLEGKKFYFEIPNVKGKFVGKFTKSKIAGNTIAFNGKKESLTLRKGEYTIPNPLDLSEEQKSILHGRWDGKIKPPGGENVNIMRFMTLNNGKFYGFIDNPTLGLMAMKIRNLSLKGEELRLELVTPPGKFRGKISGDQIDGTWKSGGQPISIPGSYKKVSPANTQENP